MFQAISNLYNEVRILKILKQIGSEVNEKVECINFGGCCVYASTVGEMLEKLGFEVRILSVGWKNTNEKIPNDEKILCPQEAEEKLGVNFHHVGIAVKVNGRWYSHDTNKTFRGLKKFGASEYRASKTYLTVNQALHFASNASFWNTMYNRNLGNHLIQKIVQKYLEPLQQNNIPA